MWFNCWEWWKLERNIYSSIFLNCICNSFIQIEYLYMHFICNCKYHQKPFKYTCFICRFHKKIMRHWTLIKFSVVLTSLSVFCDYFGLQIILWRGNRFQLEELSYLIPVFQERGRFKTNPLRFSGKIPQMSLALVLQAVILKFRFHSSWVEFLNQETRAAVARGDLTWQPSSSDWSTAWTADIHLFENP